MDYSSITTVETLPAGAVGPDDVSVRRWFAAYALLLLAAGAATGVLLAREPWGWSAWTDDFTGTFRATGAAPKLLVFAIYLSLCCTFLPLPTGWIVGGVATQAAAVGADAWTTAILVAAVGGAASAVGNLNDYHLFTWMLRHRRIAGVRRTRTYQAAARWFARAPFFILFVFNVIPIPVDVVRMLATTYRYPRLPFAGASFLGRLVRYAVIALATYSLGQRGWIAVAALFGLAMALGAFRGLAAGVKKLRALPKPAGG